MRVLLFGANGQVGRELTRALAPLGAIIGVARNQPADLALDLARLDQVEALVRSTQADVILNAAAYTAVDAAETDAEAAFHLNGALPALLGRLAAESGQLLVHYGTDYVFDGSGSRPWREDDPTGPLGVYGASKLAGEEAIRGSGCRAVVLRTSWVYAPHGRNFPRTMLQLAAARDHLEVVDDQWGAPTGAELIADVTAQVLPQALASDDRLGVFHCAAAGEINWAGYARFVLSEAKSAGLPLRTTASDVHGVSSEDFGQAARRPSNSRLDCGELERRFGLQMPHWQDGVTRVLRTWFEQLATAQ